MQSRWKCGIHPSDRAFEMLRQQAVVTIAVIIPARVVQDRIPAAAASRWCPKANPNGLRSCHTGIIGGYVIEGHVPAADIIRLLEERPDAAGLAVPGMPLGSPGMEMGDRTDAYDVILWSSSDMTVFSEYRG